MRNKAAKYVSLLSAIIILVSVFAAGAYADAPIAFTLGKEYVDVTVYSTTTTTIQSVELEDGVFPEGMRYENAGIGIVVSGTPTTLGDYSVVFRITALKADGTEEITEEAVTLSVVEPEHREITVTKSPTAETVDVDGYAMFIAAADNYVGMEWRIINEDGSNCWRGKSEIESGFRGIVYNAYTGGDGREYLELSSIPSSMNNYYVQAKFTAASGDDKFTDTARVRVNGADEAETPAPVISEEPEQLPAEPEEIPAVEDLPVGHPNVTMVEVTPEPTATPEPIQNKNENRTGNLGALILGGAAVVGAAVATAVYISLKKSEKKRSEE